MYTTFRNSVIWGHSVGSDSHSTLPCQPVFNWYKNTFYLYRSKYWLILEVIRPTSENHLVRSKKINEWSKNMYQSLRCQLAIVSGHHLHVTNACFFFFVRPWIFFFLLRSSFFFSNVFLLLSLKVCFILFDLIRVFAVRFGMVLDHL